MATDAVLQTLQKTWEILHHAEIKAAVAGGLALAVWKHPRTTFDVDVLLLAEGKVLEDFVRSLEHSGFSRTNDLPVDFGDTELLQFSIEPEDTFVDVQLDLLVAKSQYARDAIERSIALGKDALGFEINVLSCEDLILFKLLAGRVIDLSDAAALVRANVDTIDSELLDRIAEQLGLKLALNQVRREAD